MEFAFYTASVIAVLASLQVITGTNPVHALLYFTVSLLAVAVIFFAVGAPFAGILEVIVYAGAIMVLFIFVVMMLNLGESVSAQEQKWLHPKIWMGPGLLSSILLVEISIALQGDRTSLLGSETISPKQVGITLYGPYLLAVELASMLLLAALVTAYHLGRHNEKD